MAVIVTCRRGHVTHRSEIDADGRCETCARVDAAYNAALDVAALAAGEALGHTTEYAAHVKSAILKLKR